MVGALAFATVFSLHVLGVAWFADPSYLIPTVLGALWCLALFSFIVILGAVPERPDAQVPFLRRLLLRARRALYWFLAVMVALTSFAALALSFRLAMIWSGEHIT